MEHSKDGESKRERAMAMEVYMEENENGREKISKKVKNKKERIEKEIGKRRKEGKKNGAWRWVWRKISINGSGKCFYIQ